MDQMFKENNLPQVNFPSSLIGNEFRNLLDKTQDNVNVNVAQSTDPPTEVINANNTVKSKATNDMEFRVSQQTCAGREFPSSFKKEERWRQKKKEKAKTK